MTVNLLDLNAAMLADHLAAIGEKRFRAKQLLRWIHHFCESDFAAMSDLSKALREKLAASAVVAPPRLLSDHTAGDGTRKWLLEVDAGNGIETVFIPETGRGTLCISSQVGCALACTFCSTGHQGFNRNLSAAEIIGQLWWAHKALGRDPKGDRAPDSESEAMERGGAPRLRTPSDGAQATVPAPTAPQLPCRSRISNVVMMGMGEPLLNFDNLVTALELMLDDSAYGLSRRRVTVSTSGIVPAIDRLRERCPVALAVSLHAPNDALRDQLMPINRKYPLKELLAACQRYLDRAPRDFITFEYVMLDGINDRLEHARELVRLVREVPCKFNLIPFNPFPHSGYRRSPPEVTRRFRDALMQAGLVATVRKTRGEDIDAACGQLAGRVKVRTPRHLRRVVEAA